MKNSFGYIYIILSAVIFSTMEIMLKKVGGVFAPMQITTLRFLAGGLLLLPFAFRSLRKKELKLSVADFGFFALTGFLCVVISMVLYQMALTYTKASVVAIVFSCNPIFVMVLARIILREDIHKNHFIALIIEIIAIVIIINPFHTQLNMKGVILSIAAAITFSLYSVVGKKGTSRLGGITVTCFSFLIGGIELLFIVLLGRTAAFGTLFSYAGLDIFINVPLLTNIPASALPALIFICFVNTGLGFVLHMMAMEKTSAAKASIIFFLKPMIAPFFALIFLKEEIPLNIIAGIVCFLFGSGIALLPGLMKERSVAKINR